MNINKVLYRPMGLVFGALGGLAANAVFERVWKLIADTEKAPTPMQKDRGWGEVLLAASVQGAIFGLVKAAVDRGGATGYDKLTGQWPGDTDKHDRS